MLAKSTDKEFIELWHTHKSASKIAKILKMEVRAVYARRNSLADRYGISLPSKGITSHINNAPGNVQLGIENGTVLVFSDAHFWPGIRSTAFKALLWAIGELKPKAVICNGDAFDGAGISRHPRIGWQQTPSVIDELHACEAALGEIEEAAKAANPKVKLVWPLGNHDARFESRLSANAPQFEGVSGFRLADHFDAWQFCWMCQPTDDVVVKHRYKGGIHATHNNTVAAGKSIVTGHLHSLKVTPYADYNGNRYGVDTGTLAEVDGPQFRDYLEMSPTNWRSGFAVLTINNGMLLWPEVVHVIDQGLVEFRGDVLDVSDC